MNKKLLGLVLTLGLMNNSNDAVLAMSVDHVTQESMKQVDLAANKKLKKQIELLLAEAKRRGYTAEQTQAFLSQSMADALANDDNEFRLQPNSSKKKLLYIVGGVVAVGVVGYGCYKLYKSKTKKKIDLRKIDKLYKMTDGNGKGLLDRAEISMADAQKLVDVLVNDIKNHDVNALIDTVGDLLGKSEVEVMAWVMQHSGFNSLEEAVGFALNASQEEQFIHIFTQLAKEDITPERIKSVAGYAFAGMNGFEKVAIPEINRFNISNKKPSVNEAVKIIKDVVNEANKNDKEERDKLKDVGFQRIVHRLLEQAERIEQRLDLYSSNLA